MYIALRKIYTLCKFYVYVYDACVINKVLIYMVDDNATSFIVSVRSFKLTYIKRLNELKFNIKICISFSDKHSLIILICTF